MAALSAWATTMPPKTRPWTHHSGLVVVKVGLPAASGPASRAVTASTSSATVAGTTSASSASSSSMTVSGLPRARPAAATRAHVRSTSTANPLSARFTQRLSSA